LNPRTWCRTPSSVLFPILTSLIHPATPDWLKELSSKRLSLLPLRPGGVRDTIAFIASIALQTGGHGDQGEASSGLELTLEILAHASKLISSVPSEVAPAEYFGTLAPQLFALLDEDGTDMQRAAAFIIGNGILGRRIYGSPSAAGWIAFVDPIFKSLLPELLPESSLPEQRETLNAAVIVNSDAVSSAVHRLAALVLIHPNPGLVKRLVSPLLLSVWAIVCHSHASKSSAAVNRKAKQVLVTYITVSAGATGLVKLADNLSWDGGPEWKFDMNPTGCLDIRRRLKEYRETDVEVMTTAIDKSVQCFVELQDQVRSESDLLDVFVHLVSCWLLGGGSNKTTTFADPTAWNNPIRGLTYAKLTQGVLERYKDTISTNPDQILKLLEQVLTAYSKRVEQLKPSPRNPQHVMMMSLGSIVNSANSETSETQSEDEAEEIVSISLGLLDALLPLHGSDAKASTLTALSSILETLTHLTVLDRIPHSILFSATNTANEISRLLHGPSTLRSATDQTLSPHASALTTRSVAWQNLSSPLPPIRAEGLASLTTLITSSSPVLDIPSTSILLLSLLQDDEEFIYLAAIKALELLAQKHSKTVIRMLVERYVDKNEEGGLEVRLRTGEALQATVSSLGPMLSGNTTALVGESLITLAGRRGSRPKKAEERKKRKLAAEGERKEAETAWGGEVPDLSKVTGEQDEATTRIEEVLSSWEGQEDEEDVRIRASALSILGVGFEANASGFGPGLVAISVDLAISILKIEPGEEKAILRRASVALVMSIIRGIDKSDEQDPKLNHQVWFPGENIHELMEVLVYLERAEQDTIVRGHCGEALQGIRDYMANEWRRLNEKESGDIRFGLEGRLKGLDVDPERKIVKRANSKIQEVE